MRPVKPRRSKEKRSLDLSLQGLLNVAQRRNLGGRDQRVKRSLVQVLRGHLLLLLSNRNRAAPVLVAHDEAAVDQLAELVVRSLVVPVQRLQPVDLHLHLLELGELLLVGLLNVGRLRLVGVELCFGAATLRLQELVRDVLTYLLLQHVRGVAVARRDGRAALESLGELRIHLDEEVPVLCHLTVAGSNPLAHPVDEGLADDGRTDVDHPGTWELVYLVLLVRHKEVHGLEPREVFEDLFHRQVVVLRRGQVPDGVRRHNYKG